MRWGLVLTALAASTVYVMASPPVPRRPPAPPVEDLRDPFAAQPPTCDHAKSWTKVLACLEKGHVRASVLHEVEGARVVALVTEGSTSTPLRLYVQLGDTWTQTTFSAVNNERSELLALKRLGDDRYRLDQGTLTLTSAVLGTPGTSQRVWLRRQLTTVCTGSTCRSVITACDVMLDGKAYWSFHGTPRREGSSLFVVGDKSHAGTLCAPGPAIFRSEPIGDPIE